MSDLYLLRETGAKRWFGRKRVSQPAALFPLTMNDSLTRGYNPSLFAYSDSKEMLAFTEELGSALTDNHPVDVLPSGFAGETAVPGNFHAVRNVAGYLSDPLPLPLLDNKNFISDMGLLSDIRSEDVPYLKKVIQLFFGHVAPAPLHIRKGASTSFPYFTTDNQYKKMSAIKTLHNADHFLGLMTGDKANLKQGFADYHSLFLYALHERLQPDSVSEVNGKFQAKSRLAASPEESRMGKTGSLAIDSSVSKDGMRIDGHFSMRRRVVYGMSGVPNYFLAAIMGCHRSVYLKRFASTYKTRGPKDKEDKVERFKYVVGSDVKSMDTTLPKWFFDFLLSELGNYWDERLVTFLSRMLKSSFVSPPPSKYTGADYNPLFGPDPLSGTFELNAGLPSGIAINPDLGKLWMSFVYIILFKDSGAISSPDEIEAFLAGKNPNHGMLDMGDDATLMTNSPSVRDKLAKASSPYAVLEPETPVIFLGDVFSEKGGRNRAFPNPLTFIVNMFGRENSIDTMDPIRYAEGYLARRQHYSSTPIFAEINHTFESLARKHLGVNPYIIAKSIARQQKFADPDAILRDNVHYLHYRVDPADVSPELLDELVATIPASDFYDSIRHLFKVPTIPHSEEY